MCVLFAISVEAKKRKNNALKQKSWQMLQENWFFGTKIKIEFSFVPRFFLWIVVASFTSSPIPNYSLVAKLAGRALSSTIKSKNNKADN